MKVGLIGFGKAGTAVAAVIANNPSMRLEWIIRKSDTLGHRSASEFLGIQSASPGVIYSVSEFPIARLLDTHPVDTIIDFSSEEGIDYYGNAAAARRINIVSAISHYSALKQLKLRELSTQSAILWSPNITVGINFLILAAQTLKRIAPGIDIQIVEEHFKTKAEVSGTARIIANSLGVDDSDVKSVRAGGIIGVHEVLFGFPSQTVRLRHESISRDAFGDGAMFAAERLEGLRPGLYKMQDLLLPFFGDDESRRAARLHDRMVRLEKSRNLKREAKSMVRMPTG